jgi:NADH-quinone oxidoreductase subunit C
MDSIEQFKTAIAEAVPGAQLEVIESTPAAGQPSVLVDATHLEAVARFVKDDPRLKLDFCSCVTAVDYLPQDDTPGYIEVVYHLFSTELRHGPYVLKARAPRDLENCVLPSLTPVWRGCEYQEREAYDLFGVRFEGHPDLRRILMWPEFTDHPMRRDYEPPSDYEWEPTPHDETLDRAGNAGGVMPPSAAEELEKKASK